MAVDPPDTGDKAPAFPDGLTWYNVSAPVSLADMRGRFVLLNFWCASSINCRHILPELRQLEEKYRDELTVIGVHCGKFPHEQTDAALRATVVRLSIEHPVVNDPDYRIWKRYGVEAWPSLILIDPAGDILGTHSGEGIYDLFDMVMTNAMAQYDDAGVLIRRRLDPLPEGRDRAQSLLAFPSAISVDRKRQRLFISDSGHHRILVCTADGRIEDVIGCGQCGADDGSFTAATFNIPRGSVLHDDTLYICDTDNHLIRGANFSTRQVRTYFGTGELSQVFNQSGYGTQVALNSPWDICEADGRLYIAMCGPHQLWVADLNMLRIEPYAGSTAHGHRDGPLAQAQLAQPNGISTDGVILYFTDSDSSSVRTANLDPDGDVDTLIGGGLFDFGDVDGSCDLARMQCPGSVLAQDGKIFVADTYNHKIKQLDPLDHRASTLAGSGQPGLKDGPGAQAQFNEPCGLELLGNRLFVCDRNNHLIRVINLETKVVSTLEFTNFTAISPDRSKWQGRFLDLPPHQVMAGAASLVMDLQIPAAYELHAAAPIYLDWYAEDDGVIRFSSNAETIDVGPNDSPLHFRVSTASGRTALIVEAVIYLRHRDRPGTFLDLVRARVPVCVDDHAEPQTVIAIPLHASGDLV